MTEEINPPTDNRRCEYLFQSVEERALVLYVSSIPGEGYKAFRFFLGPVPRLAVVSISRVRRIRDGGTTVIETSEGTLSVRAPQRNEKSVWWPVGSVSEEEGIELVPIDSEGYIIHETSQFVTVQPK